MAYTGDRVPVPVVLPTVCPWHEDGQRCDVRRHCTRERKCGPGFALTVVRCWVHGVAFTLYPLGWTPYGRAPVVGDGSLFELVLEVASARSLSAAAGYRRTHVRAIAWAACWLGLCASQHEAVAAALDFDLAPHTRRRAAFARGWSWYGRAKLVSEAHRAIASDRRLERVLVAGFRSGCLGRPWVITCVSGTLMALV